MRARTVDFERGEDPYKSLKIGKKATNIWQENHPSNVPLPRWINNMDRYFPDGKHEEFRKEILNKASMILDNPPEKILVDVEVFDDASDEFDTYEDFENSPEYFNENNTYLGDDWDWISNLDLLEMYEDSKIIKTIPMESSSRMQLQLATDNTLYIFDKKHGSPWVSMGTIY